MDYKACGQAFAEGGVILRHWQNLAELGWQNLAELRGYVTREPYKRTLLQLALLFFSFPFSSFRFSFIDNPIV